MCHECIKLARQAFAEDFELERKPDGRVKLRIGDTVSMVASPPSSGVLISDGTDAMVWVPLEDVPMLIRALKAIQNGELEEE